MKKEYIIPSFDLVIADPKDIVTASGDLTSKLLESGDGDSFTWEW